jgi:hypothetical protein
VSIKKRNLLERISLTIIANIIFIMMMMIYFTSCCCGGGPHDHIPHDIMAGALLLLWFLWG